LPLPVRKKASYGDQLKRTGHIPSGNRNQRSARIRMAGPYADRLMASMESRHREGTSYWTNRSRDGLSLGNRRDGNSFDHKRSCAPQETRNGETGGILGIHVWNFSAIAEGAHVRTEESWEGPSLPSQIKEIQEALDASLVRWLSSLKARAEASLRL